MDKQTEKPKRIYKKGYVKQELTRMAQDPHLMTGDNRHSLGMLAAALLILLEDKDI